MSNEEKHYYEQRAEAEIAMAQSAEHPEACRSHYLLAGYYLDKVHYQERSPEKPRPMH